MFNLKLWQQITKIVATDYKQYYNIIN